MNLIFNLKGPSCYKVIFYKTLISLIPEFMNNAGPTAIILVSGLVEFGFPFVTQTPHRFIANGVFDYNVRMRRYLFDLNVLLAEN